jgi:hypothetical protein
VVHENLLPPAEPRLSLADWRQAERVFHARRETLVAVDQPLILISQIQRSGGTLLSSLFDGHPQLHVHPWEVQIGDPTKADWPQLDPAADADAWLQMLAQPWLARAFDAGYRKSGHAGDSDDGSVPMMIVPAFVDRLFRVLAADNSPSSSREILDTYFTALFNAWLDYQGLWDRPKELIVGFCPRLAWGESRARWRSDYPDGRLIAVVRDPRAWYASARSQAPDERYADIAAALAEWDRGLTEIAEARAESPDSVIVVTYERLVTEPERVMRALAERLQIDWDERLLEPTFNRRPVSANTSFSMPSSGVRTESLQRWQAELSAGDQAYIEERHLPRYEELAGSEDAR